MQGVRLCVHTFFFFFFPWIAADMELAEEDGIVRIRRRDFTKRGLPMCNSFWRPWNCYCEKFSSCNSSSSTESPQKGRIQPPYNRPHHQHHHHHSHVSLKHDCMKAVGGVNGGAKVWGCFFFFLFCEICSSQKIFEPLWGGGWHISQFDTSQYAHLILWKCWRVGPTRSLKKHVLPLRCAVSVHTDRFGLTSFHIFATKTKAAASFWQILHAQDIKNNSLRRSPVTRHEPQPHWLQPLSTFTFR